MTLILTYFNQDGLLVILQVESDSELLLGLSGSSCSVPLSNAKVFTTSDIALYDVKLSL